MVRTIQFNARTTPRILQRLQDAPAGACDPELARRDCIISRMTVRKERRRRA